MVFEPSRGFERSHGTLLDLGYFNQLPVVGVKVKVKDTSPVRFRERIFLRHKINHSKLIAFWTKRRVMKLNEEQRLG